MFYYQHTQFDMISLKHAHYVPLSAQLLECAITPQLRHAHPAKELTFYINIYFKTLWHHTLEKILKKITKQEITESYFNCRCGSPLNTRVQQIVHSSCSEGQTFGCVNGMIALSAPCIQFFGFRRCRQDDVAHGEPTNSCPEDSKY